MRVVLDLQVCQTANRLRGMGRYSFSLAKELLRQGTGHEFWVALNSRFADTVEPLRAELATSLPQERIVLWNSPYPTNAADPANAWRDRAAEYLREEFLASLQPDVVHVASLFEGWVEDAVTSIGEYTNNLATAVTLYDLIPYVLADKYLKQNRIYRDWYFRKLGHLRQAQLWMAISEFTRKEASSLLDFPETSVVNISAAVDARFHPTQIPEDAAAKLRIRYGISRPFVMYAGGIDPRKNMEGAIRGYAMLPAHVRGAHQFVLVCAVEQRDERLLRGLARAGGCAPDDVVFTGFVPDQDLVALYNLCKLFVFPSLYEGFGLPVLEAMACGAAVIGADSSSVPEVIGRADALFDPYRENEIAEKIYRGLTDDGFCADLRRHGIAQAARFSWAECARRSLEAMEQLHARTRLQADTRQVLSRPNPRRPRLAYVCPLPPEQTGIAAYSAELIPELAYHYEIEVVTPQTVVSDPWLHANFPIRTPDWFSAHAHRYDRVLYHMGNSGFHGYMLALMARHGGVVALHDFFLSGLLAQLERTEQQPGLLWQALYATHGYPALWDRSADETDRILWNYACNYPVIAHADGVIVHSQYCMNLARTIYGKAALANWTVVPHLRRIPPKQDRRIARARLGLGEADFLVCAFGNLGPIKLNHRLLDAWMASPLASDVQCHLVYVGSSDTGYAQEFVLKINDRVGQTRVWSTGFAEPEEYLTFLAAADVGVQLRTRTRGESSGTVLDCLIHGIATIVTAHGALTELPDDAVVKLPEDFRDEDLGKVLQRLRQDRDWRRSLAQRGIEYVTVRHDPRSCAEQYRAAIERYAEASPGARVRNLIRTIDELALPVAPSEADRASAADAAEWNSTSRNGVRQLLLDISELVVVDVKTGIQRVVRSVLTELTKRAIDGFRTEPVYGSRNEGSYRYARTSMMGLIGAPAQVMIDHPVNARPGDVFLGIDLSPHLVPSKKSYFEQLRSRRVGIYFVVYDLLLISHPDMFMEGGYKDFSTWLQTVSAVSDGLICISRAVADELIGWLKANRPPRFRPLKIGYFHLGCDVSASLPTAGVTEGDAALLSQLRARPSFLMVGTLEPRKQHAQALAAFERLWAEGVDVNLVIAGKQGWMVESLCDRLRTHHESGRRLHWVSSGSDELISSLYDTATALLLTSIGEGFGLPLIEAAEHGLPIVVRDLPVFREIAGKHAHYFKGSSPDDLASALKEWIDLRRRNAAPTSAAMPRQTWTQSSQQLIDVILNERWYREWLPNFADS